MERILVIGCGGAGKSTIAAALATASGLPLIHLDMRYWHAGWIATPTPEWETLVAELARAPRWVMDGNYGGTLGTRLERCDTVIFLDLPRAVCLWRIVTRWLRHRGESRPGLPAGCPEQLTAEFIWWVWTYRARRRPAIVARLGALRPDQRAVVLSSRAAVHRFVASFSAT